MHEEALTNKAAALFPHLAKFKDFYLVGGTALALQIGHRISVDFDLFTKEPLPARLLSQIKRVFRGVSIEVTYRVPGQLNITMDGVKTTFFQFEYPTVRKLKRHKDVPIADVCEIAAMKAFSIGKRLSYKDYIDWYFMLKDEHVTISQVIEIAKKKFSNDFNDRLFLGQLVSLEDIPTQEIDFLRDGVDRATIERFLKDTVKKFKI
jgi:hypothetical protein